MLSTDGAKSLLARQREPSLDTKTKTIDKLVDELKESLRFCEDDISDLKKNAYNIKVSIWPKCFFRFIISVTPNMSSNSKK